MFEELLNNVTFRLNKHTNSIWNTRQYVPDEKLRLTLSVKNAHQDRMWCWLPQHCQALLWCWVWLCCCYGNCSKASKTKGTFPASGESWSRDTQTGWARPKQILLSVAVCQKLCNICRDLSWWQFYTDLLTTKTFKQGAFDTEVTDKVKAMGRHEIYWKMTKCSLKIIM